MLRRETVTVFGRDKVLDFTYVDDCVEGITRGVEELAARRVTNETINLAFGEGNTLISAAELIADALGVDPQIETAPARLGEVTHYVADIRKAQDLLGWRPHTSLAEGIPKAVDWFLEDRALHPEREVPVLFEDAGVGWKIAFNGASAERLPEPAAAARRGSRPVSV
jgi:UDP-glucose 4-epimerase